MRATPKPPRRSALTSPRATSTTPATLASAASWSRSLTSPAPTRTERVVRSGGRWRTAAASGGPQWPPPGRLPSENIFHRKPGGNMSERPRSDLRNRAPTSRGARGRWEAPKVGLQAQRLFQRSGLHRPCRRSPPAWTMLPRSEPRTSNLDYCASQPNRSLKTVAQWAGPGAHPATSRQGGLGLLGRGSRATLLRAAAPGTVDLR